MGKTLDPKALDMVKPWPTQNKVNINNNTEDQDSLCLFDHFNTPWLHNLVFS